MSDAPIQPNAENCSWSELDVALKAAASGRSRDRMIAVRALILGEKPETLASIFRVRVSTLRTWVKRFNEQGIDGLIDKPRSGRPPKIAAANVERCRDLIEHPDKAEQTHWTAKKFHGYLRDMLKLEVGYSTVVRWLHDQGFRLKVPQPWPDRQNEDLRNAFVEKVRKWLLDDQIELWYSDETGIEGDPRPRRRWAMKGEKTRVTRNGDHLRSNVVGAICPRSGELFALAVSHSDRECFQAFLDELNRNARRDRARNLLIVDNASWHKCKDLDWGAFEPVYLPPYSPDLNPIERLWLLIKAEWFWDFVAKDRDQLDQRIDKALNWAIGRGEANQSTCAVRTSIS